MDELMIILGFFVIVLIITITPVIADVVFGGLPNNDLVAEEFCKSQGYETYNLEDNYKFGECLKVENQRMFSKEFGCLLKKRPYIAEIYRCYFNE